MRLTHQPTSDDLFGQERLTVLPHELAFVLGVSRSAVVRMIERGELPDASRDRFRRIGIEDAAELVDRSISARACSPLAQILLRDLTAGRLRVSREEAARLSHTAALSRRRFPGPGA